MLSLCLFFFMQDQKDIAASMRVEYIMLDVLAVDDQGAPVTYLTAADFEIKENRRTVELEHFETIDFTTERQLNKEDAPISDTSTEEIDPIQQTLILVLDLGTMETVRIEETILQLEDFLDSLGNRSDLQIFIFSLDRGFISRGFVQDPQIALEDLSLFEGGFVTDLGDNRNMAKLNSLSSLEEDLNRCFVGKGTDSRIDANNPGAITSGASMVTPCIENAFKIFSSFQVDRTAAALQTLENFILFMRSISGLKSIYLISPGFAYAPAQAAATLAKTYQDKAGAPSSPFAAPGTVTNNNSGNGQEGVFTSSHFKLQEVSGFKHNLFEDHFRRISHLAMANRTVLHTFSLSKDHLKDRKKSGLSFKGPQGINADRVYFNYGKEMIEGPAWLAQSSGGTHRHGGDLVAALNETLQRHRFYYVLGYPKPKGSKKYRKLHITCSRPGVTLSHAQGYYPKATRRR